mgnify:CR=1 FL=1
MQFVLGISFFGLMWWLGHRHHKHGDAFVWIFLFSFGMVGLGIALNMLGYRP